MAEGKKSFLLYCDLIHTVNLLSDEKAGELFKHVLDYVNDKNPKTECPFIKLTFEPIKQSLKRDLKKYEKIVGRNRLNGSLGGRPKNPEKPKKPSGLITNPKNPEKPDSDSDSDIEIIDKSITYEKEDFLKDWNELRKIHLKQPSFINSLTSSDREMLNDLIKDYSVEDIKNGMIGLFKQKVLPNGQTTMQSNPKHFLSHFNSYLTAYHDKNTKLYGS